jgi:hypothetical protein
MNIHTIIKKYTLSSFADARHWGTFNLLTSLPLSDDQFLKLIMFYSAAENYRNQVLGVLTPQDGYSYRFVSSPESLVAYSHFGVLIPSAIGGIIKTGKDFDDFVSNRDALFSELGWTCHEEKIVVVDTDFNEEDSTFSRASSTYQEIEELYETAQNLTLFLGN